jgi:pre-mRNA-processing factor 19
VDDVGRKVDTLARFVLSPARLARTSTLHECSVVDSHNKLPFLICSQQSTMTDLQEVASTTVQLDFTIVDVFTRQRYHGNPLAVVFVPIDLSERITKEAKQQMAREFNLSETIFIHTPDNSSTSTTNDSSFKSCRVDIFTVDEELPFAGHPIIGAAWIILDHLGWKIDALQLKAGTFAIRNIHEQYLDSFSGTTSATGNLVQVNIVHNLHVHSRTLADVLAGKTSLPTIGPHAAIAAALSVDETIRQAELHAPVVSIVQGMTALLVKLPTLTHLALVSTASRLRFNEAMQDLLLDQGPWGRSFCYRYYYVDQEPDSGEEDGNDSIKDTGQAAVRSFRARMVELATEDPATGSAACTLGAYLATTEPFDTNTIKFKITQGIEMGRRSDVVVEAKTKVVDGETTVDELALCGSAVIVMSGSVYV